MQSVRVLWFNQNKNFGQGTTESGKSVFLPGTALIDTDGVFALEEGRTVFCELRYEGAELYAFKIDPVIQKTLFDKHSDVDPNVPVLSDKDLGPSL